ncbi:unnamed protein product [Albugo candida]|uniref:Peptidase A1 domain-containing protein n=1 Tax=Albugo candida TaxID=65357 RepID=A0A024G9W6_9STRA|nr:unnamed protein product [Albugo candida]|eukprot:CCI43127.1 unnamed protein product [Albugo candida]
MKAFSLKTYAALALGAFQARHYFVAATLDLTVIIWPELSFENGRLSIDQKEKYTVSIHSDHIIGRSALTSFMNLVRGSTSQSKGIMRYDANDQLSQPLLEEPGTAEYHLAHDVEDQSSIWKYATPKTEDLIKVSHTTSWTLPGFGLEEWFEVKLLYAYDGVFFMQHKAYVDRHEGLYTYTWTTDKKYTLKLGGSEKLLASNPLEDRLSQATLVYDGDMCYSNNVRLDLDINTISIPTILYKRIEKSLTELGCRKAGVNEHFLSKGLSSDKLNPSKGSRMTISVRYFGLPTIPIDLSAYTVTDKKSWTAMFLESKDSALVFGAPILQQYSITIHKTKSEKLHYFHLARDPVSLE